MLNFVSHDLCFIIFLGVSFVKPSLNGLATLGYLQEF